MALAACVGCWGPLPLCSSRSTIRGNGEQVCIPSVVQDSCIVDPCKGMSHLQRGGPTAALGDACQNKSYENLLHIPRSFSEYTGSLVALTAKSHRGCS